MVKPWPLLSSKTLLDRGIIKVDQDTVLSPRTGDEMKFTIVRIPDVVQIVPLTAEGKLVMIHQYRHGSRRIGIEVPGGLIDSSDESPQDAARRELLEETGYGRGELVELASLIPQPAIMSTRATIFLIKNVEYRRLPELDRGEDIEVILVDPSEIGKMILDGRIHSTTTVAALMLAWCSNHLPAT